MKIRKAYRFRLKTTKKQQEQLLQLAGCTRFLWNKALALNLDRLKNKQKMMWHGELSFWLTIWRQSEEYGFLKDYPRQILEQKLMDLDKAFKDAFDKNQPLKRIPKFKKKEQDNSFKFVQDQRKPCRVRDNKIFLSEKIGSVRFIKSRETEGTVKNITVSLVNGHWYASIQTEIDVDVPIHASCTMIGVDMGIASFATLSDGTKIESSNPLKKYQKKLARAQRSLARKKKGSNNRRKQLKKVRNIHEKITNTRKDFLHKTSTQLSKNHAIIVIEDLKVANMSRSAKGTLDDPGTNVKAKSGLNRSILDQGWGEFRRQLEYKMLWNGGQVIAVPPHHTSQTCPECLHCSKENRRTQATFICVECGYKNNADIVGALNILRAGDARLACGDIKQIAA